jgi:membrane-bound lytic murein transglycosylase D
MRKIFGCLIFLLMVTGAKAQVLPDSVIVADSLEIADAESELLSKEDSVEINYYTLPTNWEYVPGDDDPLVIADRLSCIEKSIPLRYNEKIHGFINYFTVRDRAYTRMIIQRMNLYFPLFEKYLAEYNLPDELKYLAIIESGLNPRAISRARAVGLWQFMSATGRYFGLHIDWYIDERMDPEKSTRAACQYLKQLYGMFGDWELALAAYNSGPGNVKRAIRKAGYKKSFWDIYPYVPRETRSYVPQFIAITYTMNYLSEHNFIMDEQEAFPLSDTLRIKKYLHLPTLAKLTETCMDDIIKLNPSIQHNALPDLSKPYTLHLPTYTLKALNINRSAILDSASSVGKKDLELLARNASGSTYGRDKIVYKVKSGDVLGSIAIRHNVKVADLKKWNNLSSNTIRTGQRLNIWLKPSAFANVSATVAQANISSQPLPDSKTYTVQPGDTLWSISQKFQGLTIEKIKSLNKLNGSKIQPGQKLVIGI